MEVPVEPVSEPQGLLSDGTTSSSTVTEATPILSKNIEMPLSVQTDLVPDSSANSLVNGKEGAIAVDADSQKESQLSPLISTASRKEPRAKMCMSPNKAAVAACAASTVTLKAQNARKSLTTGHALTSVSQDGSIKRDKRSVRSISNASLANGHQFNSEQKKIGETLTEYREIDTSGSHSKEGKDTMVKSLSRSPSQEKFIPELAKASPVSSTGESEDRSSEKSSPGKTGPKARKTLHKYSLPSSASVAATSSNISTAKTLSLSGSSLTNVTLRLNEIEKTLGIRSSTLATIDAKSLDKLILEKATQKIREKRDSRTPQQDSERLLTASDVESLYSFKTEEESKMPEPLQEKEKEIVTENNQQIIDTEERTVTKEESLAQDALDSVVLAIRPKLFGRKKKKRKAGQYFLPGTKKKPGPKRRDRSGGSSSQSSQPVDSSDMDTADTGDNDSIVTGESSIITGESSVVTGESNVVTGEIPIVTTIDNSLTEDSRVALEESGTTKQGSVLSSSVMKESPLVSGSESQGANQTPETKPKKRGRKPKIKLLTESTAPPAIPPVIEPSMSGDTSENKTAITDSGKCEDIPQSPGMEVLKKVDQLGPGKIKKRRKAGKWARGFVSKTTNKKATNLIRKGLTIPSMFQKKYGTLRSPVRRSNAASAEKDAAGKNSDEKRESAEPKKKKVPTATLR